MSSVKLLILFFVLSLTATSCSLFSSGHTRCAAYSYENPKDDIDKLNDAEIAAHLGEVLWVAGEREEAQEVWNAALQHAPNDDLLKNVMQKFSE